jgi:hypothetical protein
MGSVHIIVPAIRLRPYLVDAVQRGIAHTLNHEDGTTGWTPQGREPPRPTNRTTGE